MLQNERKAGLKKKQKKKGKPSQLSLSNRSEFLRRCGAARADRWKICIEMQAELNLWMPLGGVTLLWCWQQTETTKERPKGKMHSICYHCWECWVFLLVVCFAYLLSDEQKYKKAHDSNVHKVQNVTEQGHREYFCDITCFKASYIISSCYWKPIFCDEI